MLPRPDPREPLFRFEFSHGHGGMYTDQYDKFLIREQHITLMRRLVKEYNADRIHRHRPMAISDIVGGALDFALSHKLSFKDLADPDYVRDVIAKETYRRAFFKFAAYYEIF